MVDGRRLETVARNKLIYLGVLCDYNCQDEVSTVIVGRVYNCTGYVIAV